MIKSEDSREKTKNIIKQIKELKEKYQLDSSDYYLTSALSGRGILDAFKKFISKIHQKLSEERQKEGIGENNIDDGEDNELVVNFFFILD